jgi:hypothetical protein
MGFFSNLKQNLKISVGSGIGGSDVKINLVQMPQDVRTTDTTAEITVSLTNTGATPQAVNEISLEMTSHIAPGKTGAYHDKPISSVTISAEPFVLAPNETKDITADMPLNLAAAAAQDTAGTGASTLFGIAAKVTQVVRSPDTRLEENWYNIQASAKIAKAGTSAETIINDSKRLNISGLSVKGFGLN